MRSPNAIRPPGRRRPRSLGVVIVAGAALVGCSSDGPSNEVEPDQVEPDGDVIFEDEVDPTTVITDPAGVVRELDGDDGDPADQGDPGEDG